MRYNGNESNRLYQTTKPLKLPSSLCYFCQQTTETIEHVFVELNLVKEIWIEFEKWLTDIFGLQTNFNK